MYLDLVGRREEALAAMKRAEAVDPLAPVWITWQGDLHWDFEQYDEAIVDLERSLDLDSEYAWTWYMLGLCYDGKELYEEAIAAHEKATALNAGFGWALAYSYALAGRRAEARDRAAALAQAPRPYAWGLAHIHAALGDEDEAFRWLEIAYRDRYAFIPWVDKVPTFESLHGDPRMADLVRRLDLPRQTGAGF